MSDLRTIYVNGIRPGDLLVPAGNGTTLIGNTDINNVLWVSRSNALIAGKDDDAIDLSPQSFMVVDGEEDVFGLTAGPIVAVHIIGGGTGYFQSGLTGSGFIANAEGIFIYSGVPGPGNLIGAITSGLADGSDQFGNVYTPGGEDLFGQGKLLIYAANPPVLRNLMIALAGAGGVDAVGNGWAPGATIFGTNGPPVGVTMPTNNPDETSSGFIATGVLNPGGGAEQGYLQIASPSWSGSGSERILVFQLGSGIGGPTGSQGRLVYQDRTGVQHSEAIWGQGGLFSNLVNQLTAVQPGTADTTLAPETWHTIPLASGWSTVAGQPVPQYRMLPDGNVQFIGSASHASFTGTTAFSTSNIPAAYRPTSSQIWIPPMIANTDASLLVGSSGALSASTGGATLTMCRFNGIMPLGV